MGTTTLSDLSFRSGIHITKSLRGIACICSLNVNTKRNNNDNNNYMLRYALTMGFTCDKTKRIADPGVDQNNKDQDQN